MDFIVHEIAPNTWLLDEKNAVTLYLVAGTEKALLIDTGFDIGELPDVVKNLTSLPVMTVISHAHVDHTTGNKFWPEIWAHTADIEEVKKQSGGAEISYHTFNDGEIIELGGRSIEVIHTPGHTPGSVCFLDKANRMLFSADTIMVGTVPVNKYEGSLKDYEASLQRIWDRKDEFDGIYPGHRAWPVTKEDLADLMVCAKKAVEGKEEFSEFCCSLITPERVEVNLKRNGYAQGRCTLTMNIIGPV